MKAQKKIAKNSYAESLRSLKTHGFESGRLRRPHSYTGRDSFPVPPRPPSSPRGKRDTISFPTAELDELITRIFCDTAPAGIADSAYLFGENLDNEKASFVAAAKLWRSRKARTVAIDDFPKGYGYPGFLNWRKNLIAAGIPQKYIQGILIAPEFPPSTHAEAWGLIRHAKKKGWKVIYVIAPPVHMLRAFVTVVSAAIKEKSKLKIYSFPAASERWEDRVTYSQETWKGRRSDLLKTELAKIARYYKKGDLISAEEVLAYLDRRDGVK